MAEPLEGAAIPEVPARPRPTREDRGVRAFTAFGIFTTVVVAVVGMGGAFPAGPIGGSLFGLALVECALPFVMAYGLGDRRAWAEIALVPVLWILVVQGIVHSLVALTQSTFSIPIDTILAAWVLSAAPEAEAYPTRAAAPARPVSAGSSIGAAILVALFFLSALGTYFVSAAVTNGGPFVAAASDRDPELDVDYQAANGVRSDSTT